MYRFHKQPYLIRCKYLLNKPREKPTGEKMIRLARMLEIAPRLADAYRLKNEFFQIMKIKSSGEGKRQLTDGLFSLETMDIPEFADCTKACHNWFKEILNTRDCPWTNGYTTKQRC